MLAGSDKLIRLYHPRKDTWIDHFAWQDVETVPLTEIGQATVQVLSMNDVSRLIERRKILDLK